MRNMPQGHFPRQTAQEEDPKLIGNLKILLRIREIPGSNLSPRLAILTEVLRGFPSPRRQMA